MPCQLLPEFQFVDTDFKVQEGDCISFTEDGTVMRLYFKDDEWKTATKNKLDAKESRFSAKESFDELFWDIFDKEMLVLLDKNCTYFFILRHSKNRIVIFHQESSLVYLKKLNNEGIEMEPESSLLECAGIYSESIIERDYSTLGEYPEIRGFRGLLVKRSNEYFLYDFPYYTVEKNIRGNTPDILYRCLTLMKNPKKYFSLIGLYPEHRGDICTLNKRLRETCIEIHNIYKCGRRVPRRHIYSKMISQLYKAHGKNAEIEDMYEIFYNQNVKFLYRLIVLGRYPTAL